MCVHSKSIFGPLAILTYEQLVSYTHLCLGPNVILTWKARQITVIRTAIATATATAASATATNTVTKTATAATDNPTDVTTDTHNDTDMYIYIW